MQLFRQVLLDGNQRVNGDRNVQFLQPVAQERGLHGLSIRDGFTEGDVELEALVGSSGEAALDAIPCSAVFVALASEFFVFGHIITQEVL
ncbi:hypothetical protein ABS71_06070 [bacterium SCN 62-11]|nr:MAG: hypothetical protein ABS71_06070 [bacterium SCN 62-11]